MHRFGSLWSGVAVFMATLSVCFPSTVNAQEYPNRGIKFIWPGAAGTAGDRYARLLAQRLTEALKQPVVVENRPGAGGNIGTEAGVRSPADGYTLVGGGISTVATNPHLYKNLSYNPLTDLVPVAGMARGYLYLFVPANSPANSLADFLRIVKASPGKYDYGSWGPGSPPHIAMELLKTKTGIDVQHVPYKGGTPQVTTALMSNEIFVAFDFYTPTMELVKGGKLKVLGITKRTRNPVVPNIPTISEQGVPDFEEVGWAGVFVPKGTPKAVVEKLNLEINKAGQSAEIQETVKNAGAEWVFGSQQEFAAYVRSEYERGAKMIKISGAQIE